MCGICGKVGDTVTSEQIARMAEQLAHRGPDASGLQVEKTFGFGHRRLSIIDLDSGKQPMSNEDDTVFITFNGEIYNFQEIRAGLEAGHRFKTRSDTEVILHLYEEKGPACVTLLRGMFSFAIYDMKRKRLFAARDHLGQKPFYYYHDGDTLAFASELKALLALDPSLREMDKDALYEYLTIRIITPPRSMFKKIRKLPPGHSLVFSNGTVQIERYWRLSYTEKTAMDFNTAVDALDAKLRETVRYHLVSDVPVGAFLSGGMDSSLIVAMMHSAGYSDFKTFSGEVPYAGYSELPYARAVSEKYRTQHYELSIKPQLMRTLPKVVWHLDEPSDALSICMYYIAELARTQVKVVLGGDGGDELFGGYDRYYGNVQVAHYAMIPAALRKYLFSRLIKLFPEKFWYRSLSHKLKWMQQMSFYAGGERYARSLSYFYFSDEQAKKLYTEQFRRDVSLFDPHAAIRAYYDADNAREAIDKMLFSDSMLRMPDHPVMILDRMTMAHGLESRCPFLDHTLTEFCAGLPVAYKVRGQLTRRIQRSLARRYLPESVLNRKKQGFSSPLPYILAKEFERVYTKLLAESQLVADGYLQNEAISGMLNEHIAKKVDHGNRLWLICNAEMWYRLTIQQCGVERLRQYLEE